MNHDPDRSAGSTRWGILGTARIAAKALLPALRDSGAVASVVGGRDLERSIAFASENGVDRAVHGYEAVIESPDVDVVYNPLPNSLHGEWTIKALHAGKAVLCEKPLCGNREEAEMVLSVARSSQKPLWEAFVFPFHRQQYRLQEILASGTIGTLVEVHSEFNFRLTRPDDVRWQSQLGGGGLND